MKRSRFTKDQIIGILKEHEAGVTITDLCRMHGVSDATVHKWKAKYGGMDVSEAKRLKGLEDENGCCRMTMHYEVVRQDDPVLRERLKELAKARRRFGYPLAGRRLRAIAVRRRLHVFLRREGHAVNHKRLFRIYREEQLQVRRRGGRKRAMGIRSPMVLPAMPNQRPLAVRGQTARGQRDRC